MIVSDGQSRGRSLLWGLKEVVDAVAVNFKILQGHLDLGGASRVLLNLPAPAVDCAQQPWDDTAIGQGLASAHGVCLAGTGAAVCKDGQVEAIEEMLDRGRD